MLKAVLIDDEIDATNALQIILKEYCPQVEIAGIAHSAIEGIKTINQTKPDIVFLDVEMPHGSGFDVLDGVAERNFRLIFTTAYNHYAIKAIKYNAIDYLLKPLDIDEVIDAVKKIEATADKPENLGEKYNSLLNEIKKNATKKIPLTTAECTEFVDVRDIVRVEADGSYTKVFLKNKKVLMLSKILKGIEDSINDTRFFRAHNSHLINMDYILKYHNREGGYIEMADGSMIPISRRKRTEFFEQMKIFNSEL